VSDIPLRPIAALGVTKRAETVEKRSDGENPAFYVPAGKIDRLPGVYLRNPQNGQLDSRSLFLVL
jgi:hypothetical protein